MPLIGYDTVNGDFVVPGDAQWAVCYMDGLYNNVAAARARFPHLAAAGRIVALTVVGNTGAAGEDIEPGNVGPGSAVGFVRARHAAGQPRPWLYADQSDMRTIVGNLERAGITVGPAGPARPWRMFTAHPTGVQHICGPRTCGFPWDADATQFWFDSISGPWHGFHGDLDVSLARDDCFNATPAPGPGPASPGVPSDTEMIATYKTVDGRVGFVVETQAGEVKHIEQQRTPEGPGDWWKDQHGNPLWLSLGKP